MTEMNFFLNIGWHQCRPTPNRLPAPGFTLIELLVVLSIVVTTLAFGIPNFQQQVTKVSLKRAALEQLELLRFTRIMAIQQGEKMTLCGTSDGLNCNQTQGHWGNQLIVINADDETVQKVAWLDASVRISNNRAASVSFSSSGWGSLASSSFFICPAKASTNIGPPGYRVVVQMSGSFRLEALTHSDSSCSNP